MASKEDLKAKFKSRKFYIFIGLMVLGTGMWYLADGSHFNDWVQFVKWTFGIYCTGNIGEHATKAYKDRKVKE